MTKIFPELKTKKLRETKKMDKKKKKNQNMMWGRKQDENYEVLD